LELLQLLFHENSGVSGLRPFSFNTDDHGIGVLNGFPTMLYGPPVNTIVTVASLFNEGVAKATLCDREPF
jgi:hypothetical protein